MTSDQVNYNAVLILNDGKFFFGESIGYEGYSIGEICFTTAITGYQHTISDPSFAGQIITFTFPHIGNVGVNVLDHERKKPLAKGVIIRNLSDNFHNLSNINLNTWLKENKIVGISGIDTRALTNHLRRFGPQNAIIYHFNEANNCNIEEIHKKLTSASSIQQMTLIDLGITQDYIVSNVENASFKVVIVDFGMKSSIASCMTNLGCKVVVIAGQNGFAEEVMSLSPDGIILSNGPGDPAVTAEIVAQDIKSLIKSNIPMLGICLGHQLIAISMGAKTTKMYHGHRGSNHPIYNIQNKKIEITSQNHGFTVDRNSLPEELQITHVSLFDNTIEGLKLVNYPVFSVQHHPEGGPGPHDAYTVFHDFIALIKSHKSIN